MKSRWSTLLAALVLSAVSQAKQLPVPLIGQHTPEWCWAASGQMVMNYLGATGVKQCEEANHELGRTDCCNSPVPSLCVQGGHTEWDVYHFTTSWSARMTFAQITSEIDHGRPVEYAWNWDGGGGHVMVIVGYKVVNGVDYVTINNPIPVDSGATYDLTYAAWVQGPGYTHQGDWYDIKDAPVCSSDFNNMPASQFQACFNYQTLHGRWPVTLSAYYSGSTLEMAGSFQAGANRPVRTLMTGAQFQSYFNTYASQGYRPAQVTVVSTSSGPLFTAIWMPVDGGYSTSFGLTAAGFSAQMSQLPSQGYILDDFYAYDDGGTKFVTTWVKKSNGGFYTYYGMTAADYNTHFSQLGALGFRPTRFDAYDTSAGTRYAAVWQKATSGYYMYYGMTPSSYQTTWNSMNAAGYHLSELTGLDDVLSAVWTK